MNNKIDDLYDRLIQKNKYVLLRNFLVEMGCKIGQRVVKSGG